MTITGGLMPREAKLFNSTAGSPAEGFLKLRGNVTPRWIANARTSRKRVEPEIDKRLRELRRLIKNRPGAKVAIKIARKELRGTLRIWETAYAKEVFYRGIRILLEIQRDGSSQL
jgi:hypothetical protein